MTSLGGKLENPNELFPFIKSENTKVLMKRAIGCYDYEFYEECIPVIWKALVLDFFEKIRELAAMGDEKAKKYIENLDKYIISEDIDNLRKVEREVLSVAQQRFGIITKIDLGDFELLRSYRHKCAHPSITKEGVHFKVDAITALSFLVKVMKNVMIQSPILGKDIVGMFMSDVEGIGFPSDIKEIERFLSVKYLERGKESLIKELIILLLKGLLKEDFKSKMQARIVNCLFVIRKTKRENYLQFSRGDLPRILDSIDQNKIFKVFSLLSFDSDLWKWFDEPRRIQIKAVLQKIVDDAKEKKDVLLADKYIQMYLFDSLYVSDLNPLLLELFHLFDWEFEEQSKIISAHPYPEFLDQVIVEYARVNPFHKADFVGSAMIIPNLEKMSIAQLKNVLGAIMKNHEVYGNWNASDIFKEIIDKTSDKFEQLKEEWLRVGITITPCRSGAIEPVFKYLSENKSKISHSLAYKVLEECEMGDPDDDRGRKKCEEHGLIPKPSEDEEASTETTITEE